MSDYYYLSKHRYDDHIAFGIDLFLAKLIASFQSVLESEVWTTQKARNGHATKIIEMDLTVIDDNLQTAIAEYAD